MNFSQIISHNNGFQQTKSGEAKKQPMKTSFRVFFQRISLSISLLNCEQENDNAAEKNTFPLNYHKTEKTKKRTTQQGFFSLTTNNLSINLDVVTHCS